MSNKLQVNLRVQDSVTFIEGRLDSPTYQGLKKTLGYQDEKAIWRTKQLKKKLEDEGKDTSWLDKYDGVMSTVCYNKKSCKCSIKKDGTHFPTGLLAKAREFFNDCNVGVSLINQRSAPSHASGYAMSSEFESRDYQKKIIEDACNRERGIIKIATGGGKTGVASAVIANLAATPTIFYVTSIDLLKQAKSELERFISKDGKPLKVGTIGGGKFEPQDVTVMTVQTAIRALGHKFAKYDDEDDNDTTKLSEEQKKQTLDLIHSCKNMVADEVQHWAAKTCQIIADHSYSSRYRFGLSATPWRDMGDDMLIDGCFGKCIADINASFLIDQGHLVKPTIYFVHTKHSTKMESYPNVYQEGIVENKERNLMISHIAKKMVESGRQILILVRIIEHGKFLEAMIPGSFFINGSHSGNARLKHLELMRQRKADITISTSIFDEGVDIKPLDGLILAGSGKSQTRALQRVGRVLRPFTDKASGYVKNDAFVVDFYDVMKFMKGHSSKRRHIYQTEPRFIIKDWK